MGKHIYIRLRNFSILIPIIILSTCKNFSKEQAAQKASEQVLVDISNGPAAKDFPTKYFPRDQSVAILADLKNKCDFANRKGNFVNDFYQSNPNDGDLVSFIYEYYLKCGKIRLILTYKISDEIELFNFRLEPTTKSNSMVTRPENQLK